MIEYEEIITLIEDEKPVKAYCDVCGNEIKNKDQYYEINAGHFDWRHDSGESVKLEHICNNTECLKHCMDEYVKNVDGKRNSHYIEIYHEVMTLYEPYEPEDK